MEVELDLKLRSKPKPVPICGYNWKASYWASKSERELSEICFQREIPRYGPKAAKIKWLDTGVVEYQDLYIASLLRMAKARGLKAGDNMSKDKFITLLLMADEKTDCSQGAWRCCWGL